MLRVRAIPGEPTRFYCESMEVRCSNPACSKLYPKTPNGHARFSDAQKATLRSCGVWPKVAAHLKRLAKEFHPRNMPGELCRRCGAVLEEREHLVDVAGMDYAGMCSCEFWTIVIRKKLEALPPGQRMCFEETCGHVPEAQRFAYQLALRLHEVERMKDGRGRREEDAA